MRYRQARYANAFPRICRILHVCSSAFASSVRFLSNTLRHDVLMPQLCERQRGSTATRLPTCLALLILFCSSISRCENAETELQRRSKGSWGYIQVRRGAHMFWWLEPCKGCHDMSIFEEPLIIWLQGGPGASSAGYGNFEEIGPYKRGWKPRKHSWVNAANVLFVDSPVGAGYSYVEDASLFATTDAEAVADLMVLFKEFVWGHPEFHFAPIHIFCESYGGKIGISFARAILEEQKRWLPVNFRGIALGDSWISPADFVEAWPRLLQAMSVLEYRALAQLTNLTRQTQLAVSAGNNSLATEMWAEVEGKIEALTDNVNFYNVLLHNEADSLVGSQAWLSKATEDLPRGAQKLLGAHHSDTLFEWMNTEVREYLRIIPDEVTWGGQAAEVFQHMSDDFMTDVIADVDFVLAQGLNVTVYSGQLDLICCTLGLDAWLAKLSWPGMPAFRSAPQRPLYLLSNGIRGGGGGSGCGGGGACGGTGGDQNEAGTGTGADPSRDVAGGSGAGGSGKLHDSGQLRRSGGANDSSALGGESPAVSAGPPDANDLPWRQRPATWGAVPLGAVRPESTAAFVIQRDNLAAYMVLDAGHMVPADQPETALQMVARILGYPVGDGALVGREGLPPRLGRPQRQREEL